MAYTGFNRTGMIDTDYIDQIRDGLIPKLVTEGITTSIVDLIPGVKNSMTLNGLNNVITVQDGGCGFNPAGDVQLIQKELRVYPKKINDALCPDDLETTYLSTYMRNNKEIPFSQIVADSYVNKANLWNEMFIWDGDGTVDGLVKEIANDDNVVDASSAVDSATGYIKKLEALLEEAPTEVLMSNEGVVFCTFKFFMGYMNELRAANNYMLANTEYPNGGYVATIPGTNIRLVATVGLSKLQNSTVDDGELLIYTNAKNIAVGTDMLNDAEMFDMRYSFDTQQYKVAVTWKIGATYRYSDYIVKGYTLA